jgi:hypothetical protein
MNTHRLRLLRAEIASGIDRQLNLSLSVITGNLQTGIFRSENSLVVKRTGQLANPASITGF